MVETTAWEGRQDGDADDRTRTKPQQWSSGWLDDEK